MISIGDAARRSGTTVATVRYYEEIGLVAHAVRNSGGRRVFTHADVERLRLIRRLRSMEFSLDAIKDLMASMNGGGSCLDVRDLAKSHLEVLRVRRSELDALERTLSGIAGMCSSLCVEGPSDDCSIVGDLRGA